MYPTSNSPPPSHATPPTSVSSSGDRRKPNILFIMADQVSAPLLRIHDENSPIKTPHIDALAAKSAVFTSAYCPSPLCAPARSSLVTGQLPTRIAAWDNASPLGVDVPTYAHYLRREGYETALAGKMHFIGEQLHGFEERLTSDIYPGDFGWGVNWDEPDRRLEWYHNSSSILQAGPCLRSNQLDFDEEVMFKSTRYLYAAARHSESDRPFCLTVSLTHPHDPYTIHDEYWSRYADTEIPLPSVNIPREAQDPHSKRLQKVCDLEKDLPVEAIKRARRAYFGAVSYVDDNVGKLMRVLKDCKLDDNTIVIFSSDHGDMLGERGLWYKMSWFEASARVPLLISYPSSITPRRISENVSTLDILPTMVDLVGGTIETRLPLDGTSLVPQCKGQSGADVVYGEYAGEGTVAPYMMIKRGSWKYVVCPADPPQLYDLSTDPAELVNLIPLLTSSTTTTTTTTTDDSNPTQTSPSNTPSPHPNISYAKTILHSLSLEASQRWNFPSIHADVLRSQRNRRVCWDALKQGRFEAWDWTPREDGAGKYIRSTLPLDELELRARYPPVDELGREKRRRGFVEGVAGAAGE